MKSFDDWHKEQTGEGFVESVMGCQFHIAWQHFFEKQSEYLTYVANELKGKCQ